MVNTSLTQNAVLTSCCVLGSFVLYLLNRLQKKQPFSFLQALNIDVSHETGRPRIILLDMLLSSTLGGGVVMLITAPNTTIQAVVAGLGMTGLLSVHTKGQDVA